MQSFTAQAQWDSTLVATAGLAGTVTSVAAAQGETLAAAAGATVYDVNLIPVVVFAGAVPAFRALAFGAVGDDVRQLQEGLAAVGFESGAADGQFDAGVTSAVARWQRSLGIEGTGRVPNGQVRFVPILPATLVLAAGIEVGRQLSGAEEALRALAPAPRFSIPLSPEQRDLVPLDVPVNLTHADGEWSAVILSATEVVEDGQPVLRLALATADGSPVCADRCDQVATHGITDFPAAIILVPMTTGPVVPAAAVQTDARGATFVAMADGSARPVTIRAQARGQAVVDGVGAGEHVRLPDAAE
ncbi:MAG: peptidoglycan-binding domain-containing protein [Geodermatophilaceae bacterium]